MENQVNVMADVPARNKCGSGDSAATPSPVEDASASILHTESCPNGCYRFVSRYLLTTYAEAEPSAGDYDRPAAGLLKAA